MFLLKVILLATCAICFSKLYYIQRDKGYFEKSKIVIQRNDNQVHKRDSVLPKGFCYLTDIVGDDVIIEDSRYYGSENFIGRRITGYEGKRIICTEKAAYALQKVVAELREKGFKLVLYDGYRPQKAVDEFVRWAEDENDIIKKDKYYPNFANKKELFEQGYIAARSSHSRGSTVDLTIIESGKPFVTGEKANWITKNGKPYLNDGTLDMGSSFDLFDPISNHGTKLISPEQEANRRILLKAMQNAGFKKYDDEWWHYTLEDEPFPDQYFDFI